MIKTVLTIAGSDSCGGAGVQTDIKTIALLGAYGVCAITALTAQNTLGIHDIYEIPADFIGKQIDSLANDFEIAAVKTGMLVNPDIVHKVADRINRFGLDN
jgi:hydroxymethylpyrimidine/phosphomethylpyrimidine kinase